MKQRISIADLEDLSAEQQQKLRDIWMPERYDIAVSKLCINAETDEYEWLEFAVGDIELSPQGVLILNDLRITDGFVKINEGEGMEDEADFMLKEPASFLKTQSLPLLTIGQMITMLHLLDKRNYHFYLLTGNGKYGCEIGDFNSELKPSLLTKPDKDSELTDVLWSTLKMIL